MSRPSKSFEEADGRIQLSPKKENIEYVRAKHGNVSAWFDAKAEEEQATDPVFRRAVKARKLKAAKVQTDDGLSEFAKIEGCSVDEAIAAYEAAKVHDEHRARLVAQEAECEKMRLLLEGLGSRTGSEAINWLSSRAKDFGYPLSGKEVYDMVTEFRKRMGGGQ